MGAQMFPSIDSSGSGIQQHADSDSGYNNSLILKPSQIGQTYNTRLKAEIEKRANVALRPYDQHKYANKLGTPARARPG